MKLCRYDDDRMGVVIGDMVHDVTAARRDLGYRYTVPVRRGFASVVAHLDTHGAIADVNQKAL